MMIVWREEITSYRHHLFSVKFAIPMENVLFPILKHDTKMLFLIWLYICNEFYDAIHMKRHI